MRLRLWRERENGLTYRLELNLERSQPPSNPNLRFGPPSPFALRLWGRSWLRQTPKEREAFPTYGLLASLIRIRLLALPFDSVFTTSTRPTSNVDAT